MKSLTYDTHKNILKQLMVSFQYRPETEEEAKLLIDTYFKIFKSVGFDDESLKKVANRLVTAWEPSFGVKFPMPKTFTDLSGLSVCKIAERFFNAIESRIKVDMNNGVLFLGKNEETQHKRNVAFKVIEFMGGWKVININGYYKWSERKDEFMKLFEEFYYKESVNKDYLLGATDMGNKTFLDEHNKHQIGYNPEDKLMEKINQTKKGSE